MHPIIIIPSFSAMQGSAVLPRHVSGWCRLHLQLHGGEALSRAGAIILPPSQALLLLFDRQH